MYIKKNVIFISLPIFLIFFIGLTIFSFGFLYPKLWFPYSFSTNFFNQIESIVTNKIRFSQQKAGNWIYKRYKTNLEDTININFEYKITPEVTQNKIGNKIIAINIIWTDTKAIKNEVLQYLDVGSKEFSYKIYDADLIQELLVSFVWYDQTVFELENFAVNSQLGSMVEIISGQKSDIPIVLFNNKNLAGHAIVVFWLLYLVIARYSRWTIVSCFLTGLIVFWTGSRTAFLVFLFSSLWLFCFTYLIKNRVMILMSLSFTILGLLVVSQVIDLTFLEQGDLTRQSIWKVALQTIQTNFFTGVSANEFAQRYSLTYPAFKEQSVLHAHNFWLQLGVNFGVWGLVFSILLTIYPTFLAWRWANWRGLGFIIPFWLLNSFDYSLHHIAIWLPMILGMTFLYQSQKNDVSGKLSNHKVV